MQGMEHIIMLRFSRCDIHVSASFLYVPGIKDSSEEGFCLSQIFFMLVAVFNGVQKHSTLF